MDDFARCCGNCQRRTFTNLLSKPFDADFPKSFSVNVKVTWRLKKDLGGNDTATVEATFEFDAIKYVYSAQPTVEIDGRGDGALVDSHEGRVQISAAGCRRKDLLDMKFSTVPTSATSQNEIGSTDMVIQGADNSLVRSIPRPYWYAKSGNPPDCCYSNPAEYKISLKADGCIGHERTVDVYLPMDDHDSMMSPRVEIADIIVKDRRINNVGDLVLTLCIVNYAVRATAVSHGSSQYVGKIFNEEKIHAKQVNREQGYGFEDLYSISDALEGFDITMSTDVFQKTVERTFASEDEAAADIEEMLGHIIAENDISGLLWKKNEAYSEFDAKRRVGFREAYLYHCCYEKKYGPNPRKVTKGEVIREYYYLAGGDK